MPLGHAPRMLHEYVVDEVGRDDGECGPLPDPSGDGDGIIDAALERAEVADESGPAGAQHRPQQDGRARSPPFPWCALHTDNIVVNALQRAPPLTGLTIENLFTGRCKLFGAWCVSIFQ